MILSKSVRPSVGNSGQYYSGCQVTIIGEILNHHPSGSLLYIAMRKASV